MFSGSFYGLRSLFFRCFMALFCANVLTLLSSCEDDPVKRDYPRVKTLEVTNITEAGATFTGEVLEEGNSEITEHGFVWATRQPDVEYSNKVLLGSFSSTGKFSAEVGSNLTEGLTYQVAAFVISGEFTVYGEPVTFKSLGSEGPKMTGFLPDSALCGDTITITGRNFSWARGSNIVMFNDAQGLVCGDDQGRIDFWIYGPTKENN